jgi:hypothetical protein
MAHQYAGKMDDATAFSAERPFAVRGWPSAADIETFDTEQEAKNFVVRLKKSHPFHAGICLYGFSEGRWVRL